MYEAVLVGALDQAQRSDPSVRAAALLRIARVESAADRDRARQTFLTGLAATQELIGRDREYLLEQASLIAAAVDPALISQIHPAPVRVVHRQADRLGESMIDHGHISEATSFLLGYSGPDPFPFILAHRLLRLGTQEGTRLAILRRAVEAWRADPQDRDFPWVFQQNWQALPTEEARTVLREYVNHVLSQPDQYTSASYDAQSRVEITSIRQHLLFDVFHILRRLDAPLAEAVLKDHEQLATLVRRFPNGHDTIREEAEERQRQAPASCSEPGYFMMGSTSDFPYLETLIAARRSGDFTEPLAYAAKMYDSDAAADRPNLAPREFWPSICAYRQIFYEAARRLGPVALTNLTTISDPDVRLFAQIECIAALEELPQFNGTRREYRPVIFGTQSSQSGRGR